MIKKTSYLAVNFCNYSVFFLLSYDIPILITSRPSYYQIKITMGNAQVSVCLGGTGEGTCVIFLLPTGVHCISILQKVTIQLKEINLLGAFLNMCFPKGKLSDKRRLRSKDLDHCHPQLVCLNPLCTVR